MTDATILVTGATGQLGSLVINALLETEDTSRIAALVRPKDHGPDPRVERLTHLGINTRIGDYDDPASLRAAMIGVERLLFNSSSSFEPRGPQHRNVVDAAVDAGVGFVAYTSILDAQNTPLLLAVDHRETEDMIESSGLSYVILRNGWYLENHMMGLPHAIESGAIHGAARSGRFSSASRGDYATAAATVIRTGADGHERILELAGDTGYTLAQLAGEVARQSGKSVRYDDTTPAAFADTLRAAGLPDGLATVLADTDEHAAEGALHDDSGTLGRLIGRPTTLLCDAVAAALKSDGSDMM